MACEAKLKPKQTVSERATEVRAAVSKFNRGLILGTVKVAVGPQGAIAFTGINDTDRDGVTDACVYRRLMVSGSALAKAAIAKAEQLAGRAIDTKAIAQGHHSHDGVNWHSGH